MRVSSTAFSLLTGTMTAFFLSSCRTQKESGESKEKDPVAAAAGEIAKVPMPEDYIYLELFIEPDIEKLKQVKLNDDEGLKLKMNHFQAWMVPKTTNAVVPTKQLIQLVTDFSGAPPTTDWKTWRISTSLDYARDLYFGGKAFGKKIYDAGSEFDIKNIIPNRVLDEKQSKLTETYFPKLFSLKSRLSIMGEGAFFFDNKTINDIPEVAKEIGLAEAFSHQKTLMSSVASRFFKTLGGYMGPAYKENWDSLVDNTMQISYDSYRILTDVSSLNAIYKGQSGDYMDALIIGGSLLVRGTELVRDGIRKAIGTWDATYNPKAYAEYLYFLEKKDPNAPLLAQMKKLDTTTDQKIREAIFTKLKESMLSDVDFRKDMRNRGFFASYILPLPTVK